MKKQLLQTAVITAILSGVNGIVSAGGGQDADVMPVYTLDDVIVTAQRAETKELDTPASTTVITREEIAQSGAKSAADVLSKVNGFTYKSMGQGGASLGTMVNELRLRGAASTISTRLRRTTSSASRSSRAAVPFSTAARRSAAS